MEIQTVLILGYVAGVIGCGLAGDKRTIGGAGAAALALFATPLVAAPLLACWPDREEAKERYERKAQEAKERIKTY